MPAKLSEILIEEKEPKHLRFVNGPKDYVWLWGISDNQGNWRANGGSAKTKKKVIAQIEKYLTWAIGTEPGAKFWIQQVFGS